MVVVLVSVRSSPRYRGLEGERARGREGFILRALVITALVGSHPRMMARRPSSHSPTCSSACTSSASVLVEMVT